MYKVWFNGDVKELEAEGIRINSGSLLFVAKDGIRHVIPAGKWDHLEIGEGSNALQIESPAQVPVQSEPGASEGVPAEDAKEQEAAGEGQAEEQEVLEGDAAAGVE